MIHSIFGGMLKKLSLIAIGCGLLLLLGAFAWSRAGRSDYEATRELIAMRSIAHRVLLQIGDSTTAILPVSSLSSDHYRLSFDRGFAFRPDSLARIIDGVIATDRDAGRYIVTVLEARTDQVVYGYSMMGPHREDLVACGQRRQPERRYSIDIRFEEQGRTGAGLYMGGAGLLLAGLLLLGAARFSHKMPTTSHDSGPSAATIHTEPSIALADTNTPAGWIRLSAFRFHPEQQQLELAGTITSLTAKESRILHIFAASPSTIIDRRRLQKEIWEDEGVIVGRSLDMFISRLRRKLEADPGVRLVNIHGKGYRLEVAPG